MNNTTVASGVEETWLGMFEMDYFTWTAVTLVTESQYTNLLVYFPMEIFFFWGVIFGDLPETRLGEGLG